MKTATTQVFADKRDRCACVIGGSVFLVLWFYSLDLVEALKFFAFFVLFNCLPGVVLLDALFTRWRDQAWPPLLLIAFAPVAGAAFMLPWWAADLKWGYFLIPVISLLLFFWTSRAFTVVPKCDWPQWPRTTYLAIMLLSTPLITFSVIWVEGLNPHLLYQATIAANLGNGYPPEFPFIAHVPLAYNYVAQIWVAAAAHVTGIPIENVVVYAAPALLVYCSAAGMAAVGLYAGIGVWIAGLVVACAFWYAGWTPIGAQLLGRSFIWSAVLLIGPLLAFCGVFVLVVALADWFSSTERPRNISAYAFAFIVMLVIVGSRAPAALIVVCAVSGLVLWEIVFRRKFNLASFGMVAVVTAATTTGMIVFLRYGSGFDFGGFTRISATPFAYLGSFSFFWLPPLLIAKGFSPYWAGVVQFLALIVLPAGFLMPFLFWEIKRPSLYSPLEVLLLGAGIAGIGAIFFLESFGASHFSFFHYTTLAFTLLGGIALSKITAVRTGQFYATIAIACVLALFQAREIPFRAMSGLVHRLASITSPKRMAALRCAGEPRLEAAEPLDAGATVVLPADLDMCARLRLMLHNPQAGFYLEESLRLIADWETSLKSDLSRKVALLNAGGPKALAAVLPAPSYFMVRHGDQVALERAEPAR